MVDWDKVTLVVPRLPPLESQHLLVWWWTPLNEDEDRRTMQHVWSDQGRTLCGIWPRASVLYFVDGATPLCLRCQRSLEKRGLTL